MATILTSIYRMKKPRLREAVCNKAHREQHSAWAQRVRTGVSGRGNTMNEDEKGSSTDRREMNRCLIQLPYKVLGGERRL